MFAVRPLFLIVLLLSIAVPSIAQHQIVANPHAVKLRKIWQVWGATVGGDQVGSGVGGLGDIFGTGYGAWAVAFGKAGEARIYRGGPDTLSAAPVRVFERSGLFGGVSTHALVGRFQGANEPAMIGMRSGYYTKIDGATVFIDQIFLYKVDSGRIADSARYVVDPWQMKPSVLMALTDVLAVDLDGDGADELVVVMSGARRNGVGSSRGEVWIYHGGANFQVDSPSVVIRDEQATDYGFFAYFGALNDDPYPDLLTSGWYPNRTVTLKFFWGRPDSPWFATVPDRVDSLSHTLSNIDAILTVLDVDGDGRSDILQGHSYENAVYLFRSGGLETFDRRSVLHDPPDYIWKGMALSDHGSGGYLSDSSHRYAMTALFAQSPFNSSSVAMLLFAGGVNGPDSSDEAYYDGTLDGLIEGSVFERGGPIPDVNGDGWDDYIGSNPEWYTGSSTSAPGIAIILAGGPYIPRDSVSLGVRDIAIEGKSGGLSVWPNPVSDELNIAWRGDLRRMPSRFEVHDMLGRLIASGNVEPWRGAALWHCADAPAGVYLLSIYDASNNDLVCVDVAKQ